MIRRGSLSRSLFFTLSCCCITDKRLIHPTGKKGYISCAFTHIYTQTALVYFSAPNTSRHTEMGHGCMFTLFWLQLICGRILFFQAVGACTMLPRVFGQSVGNDVYSLCRDCRSCWRARSPKICKRPIGSSRTWSRRCEKSVKWSVFILFLFMFGGLLVD